MDRPRLLLSAAPNGAANYENALTQLGACVTAGYCPPVDLNYDGLVLCGGGDLECSLYGQENCGSEPPDKDRDAAELALFDAYFQAGKPIFGICRGMQLINVALGGTLIQDLPTQLRLFHRQSGGDQVHPIRTQEGSFLHTLYGPTLTVNSFHHQALDTLGRDLEVTAWSEGGLPEALQHRSLPILGVQFHPERMSCGLLRPDADDGAAILQHFLALCTGR